MNPQRSRILRLGSMLTLCLQMVCAAVDEGDEEVNPVPTPENAEGTMEEVQAADPSIVSSTAGAESGAGAEASRAKAAKNGSNPTSRPSGQERLSEPSSRASRRQRRAPSATGGRDEKGRTRRGQESDHAERAGPSSIAVNAGSSGNTRREYSAFKAIAERNIFNASRSPRSNRSRGEGRRPNSPAAESITLVGTLSSEKGSYAFFDGSKAEFKQVLQPGKTIAEHTVAAITNDGIQLQIRTNTIALKVGEQLRHQEDGWRAVTRASPSTKLLPSHGEASADATSSSDESDVISRLMRAREQELK